mmetsp:Transcript_18110/g.50003  ORF Transcript_18110/g.50003 Transcript_18110/m.50003 type:complete len:82 (+) Transcript_18110:733-978(+)
MPPVLVAKVPSEHPMHAVRPKPGPYVPRAQAEHMAEFVAPDPVQKDPAVHEMQAEAPEAVAYTPAQHRVQAEIVDAPLPVL